MSLGQDTDQTKPQANELEASLGFLHPVPPVVSPELPKGPETGSFLFPLYTLKAEPQSWAVEEHWIPSAPRRRLLGFAHRRVGDIGYG